MVCACLCTIIFTVSQFHTDVYFSPSCLPLELLMFLHPSIVHVFRCSHQTQHLRFETSFRPEDHTDWEMVPPSYDLQSPGNIDLNEHLRIFYPHDCTIKIIERNLSYHRLCSVSLNRAIGVAWRYPCLLISPHPKPQSYYQPPPPKAFGRKTKGIHLTRTLSAVWRQVALETKRKVGRGDGTLRLDTLKL